MPNPNPLASAPYFSAPNLFARPAAMKPMRRLGSRLGVFVLSLALVLLLPELAPAQTATGSIIGTITDSTGAVISGATMTSKSASTGTTQTRTPTASGTYSIVALDPGDYSVTVRSSGF